MGVSEAIDITTGQRNTILGLLKRHLPATEAWAYGSRVKWTSRPESDLDMVVFASPEQKGKVSELKDALAESDLPFRVDLFVWDEVPESFRKNIEAERVVLQKRSQRSWPMGSEGYTNPAGLGQLPQGWCIKRIEELCDKVTSGGTPLRSNRSFYENGKYNWFKTKELKDVWLDESEEKISWEALQRTSAKLFPPDTVLMAMYGDGKTITSLGILRKESATNQACCAMIPDKELCEPRFLFYALKHHREDFIHLATGGAQRNLSGKLIKPFALKVPPLPEQRAIAHILGSLDDKIELNRQMNRTLEQMAQALFKSWFIDFDPVRAKAQGRETGLPKDIADLFPDSFQESELGEIPKGWKVGELQDLLVLQRGFDLPKKKRTPGEYPLVAASGQDGYHSEYKANGPGVATGRSGKLGIVTFVHSNFWPLNTTLWIKTYKRSNPYHAYFLLRTLQLETYNAGSAVPTLNRNHIHNLRLPVPSEGVLNCFALHSKELFSAIRQNIAQTNALSRIRDTLLPKLISGESAIPDAEKLVEGGGV